MSRNYRTAQGKSLDMNALRAKNERLRAVGNMKVNARGDTIDSAGNIVVPVTEKVGKRYQKTVGNRSAQNKQPKQVADEFTVEELEMMQTVEEDKEIEKIKAQEQKKKK